MKNLKHTFLLLISVTMFATAFSQPTISNKPKTKIVPDSMVCITPAQDEFNINQAFTIQELKTSIVLKDKAIEDYTSAVFDLKQENSDNKEVIKQNILKNKVCLDDNKYITGLLHTANVKIKLKKIVIRVGIPVAVLVGGYIGYSIKK